MVISYQGGECFKITQGDLTIAYNPPSKDSSIAATKFGADIALVSMHHDDFAGVENAAFGEREPFVVEGPGEYEIKGVQVRGFGNTVPYDGEQKINTVYGVTLEGMNLAFLGAQTGDVPAAAKQELDDIDVLFVPLATLGAAEAYKLSVKLEPKVVVPMHYDAAQLKAFLKEAGAEGTKPEDKLTVKRKDLEGKEVEVVVLSH
ncbi:MAG: MBL fold metallo-hydrolase [Patescibacteria group bacterium]